MIRNLQKLMIGWTVRTDGFPHLEFVTDTAVSYLPTGLPRQESPLTIQ